MYQLDVDSLQVEYKYFSGEGVMCLCEYHDDSHPSMFVNLVEGNFYCFACGMKGLVSELVKVTGGIEKYVPYNLENKKSDNDEWLNLLSYSLATNDTYLLHRGFTNEIIEKWDIRSNEQQVIIPMKQDNKVGGVKIRLKSPKNKVKYLTFGVQPTYLHNFTLDVNNTPFDVIITEGIFGLIRYDMLGYKAVTPISVNRAFGLKKLIENYKNDYYIAFDPDIAGYFGSVKLLYTTRAFKNIWSFIDLFDVDDVNEVDFNKPKTSDYNRLLNKVGGLYGEQVFVSLTKQFNKYKRIEK